VTVFSKLIPFFMYENEINLASIFYIGNKLYKLKEIKRGFVIKIGGYGGYCG